ncbi:hypothetical protein BX666DRAFT_2099899 [Dichotomocladium elegans]|nr:hypothetical protein BX666DRAFT_2099899 [Dichotomocladium elegans]
MTRRIINNDILFFHMKILMHFIDGHFQENHKLEKSVSFHRNLRSNNYRKGSIALLLLLKRRNIS